MMKTPTLVCDDGTEVELPFHWEICGHCRGNGTSSAYLGAYTSDEWSQQDPEWQEDYIAGRFDRTCDDCGGSGKVKRVTWGKLTREQRRQWNAQVRADREYEAAERSERRMLGEW
jgi:hypothetical protein